MDVFERSRYSKGYWFFVCFKFHGLICYLAMTLFRVCKNRRIMYYLFLGTSTIFLLQKLFAMIQLFIESNCIHCYVRITFQSMIRSLWRWMQLFAIRINESDFLYSSRQIVWENPVEPKIYSFANEKFETEVTISIECFSTKMKTSIVA